MFCPLVFFGKSATEGGGHAIDQSGPLRDPNAQASGDQEGETITRIMAISLHPYTSGVPHRISYLE